MNPRGRLNLLLGLAMLIAPGMLQAQSAPPTDTKEHIMSHAKGEFTVKLEPQADASGDPKLARMTIDKQFTGDLTASSKGQMLSASTEAKGSAGYVAIEKVTGTLSGHTGSFILQHNATMDRGTPNLNIIVVPDSGTGELTGLMGSMKIMIAEGKHSYDFEFALKP